MMNLDLEALKVAQQILGELDEKDKIKNLENQLTKSLGVLTENGIYAFFVYLLSKMEDDVEKDRFDPCRLILGTFLDILRGDEELCAALKVKREDIPSLEGNKENERPEVVNKILKWVLKEIQELQQVLLLRDFLMRVLAYGRYITDARKKESESKGDAAAGGGGTP